MKNLRDILYRINILKITGSTDKLISSITFDSRIVNKSSLFVAFKGTRIDGHDFIEQAVIKGAVVIICEKIPKMIQENVTYIKVKDSQEALAVAASNFYNKPSSKLKLIGVTGTNGKTTIVSLLYELFRNLGYKTALLSTIHNKIDEKIFKSTHTTPDPLQINDFLNNAIKHGCDYAFMEVSSHAIIQKRIAGLSFTAGIFTNITHEHLDYHKSFRNYLDAKKSFFDSLGTNSFAITNIDDKNGSFMLQNTDAKKYTYSLNKVSDFKARIIERHIDGLLLNIQEKEIWTKLSGTFNAYNLLAVFATAILLGQQEDAVLTELSKADTVEGRFDKIVSENGKTAIIDYAHSPDALSNILNAINNVRNPGQNLITLVGAGGDRDKDKRPLMGQIAAENSDKVIITSDNPRTENPETIIKEIKSGIKKILLDRILTITNRKEAIKTACMLAAAHDIILVAGKGHEKYQEINGIRHDFDDKQIIKEIFNPNNS